MKANTNDKVSEEIRALSFLLRSKETNEDSLLRALGPSVKGLGLSPLEKAIRASIEAEIK